MARTIRRTWKSPDATGRKLRRVAYGYQIMVGGKRERKWSSEWQTEDDALRALVARQAEVAAGIVKARAVAAMTFGEARDRYLKHKEAEGKPVRDDRQYLARFAALFGESTPLRDVTAARISEYRTMRASEKSKRRLGPEDGENKPAVSAATVNRSLATLRHLLRLAVEEWEVLDKAPVIRLLKEPQGRIRWLGQDAPDEEARLQAACEKSANANLAKLVTVALESGMRQGEVMGLMWERVDFSRGVIRLEKTKSGRRREVPMRQAVYDALAPLRADALASAGGDTRELRGRVWPDRRFPRTAWEAAVKRAGIEDFHFHDCRHHFASWFMMRGGNLLALKDILGHRDIKMTQRYAHLAPEHLRAEMERTAAPRSAATAPDPAPMAQGMAQDGIIDPAAPVSTRSAGVAQRQSN